MLESDNNAIFIENVDRDPAVSNETGFVEKI